MLLSSVLLSFSLPSTVFAVNSLVKLDYTSYQGTSLANGISQWLGIRFAAPPVGKLRFQPPQDPPHNSSLQVADQHGLICLSTAASPTDNTTSEDCLFLDVYAPTNTTKNSKLPVYFFIQGGGFNTDSNPNFNGSGLIEASDMNIVIVTFNYRVGLYGFLASKEVEQGGSLNNGLKDQIKALQWVQKYISDFGGNPDHVVIGGDSAGAASVTLLLTAYGGRNDHLFVGSAAESQSFATVNTVAQSQYQYDELVIRAACSNTTNGDSLNCLRGLTAAELQAININTPFPGDPAAPLYQYSPTLDNDLVPDHTYTLFTEGKFIKVPTIFGDDTNGGATFCPPSTANLTQSNNFLRDQFPALTLGEIWQLNKLYEQTDERFVNTGDYYRQCSNVYGDMRYTCPGLYLSKRYTQEGLKSWTYRYNVQDPAQVAAGLGVPHTVEINAIWGPQYVTGTPPASYNVVNGTNRFIIPVIQGYWTSFVRALDPNTYRYKGTPVWEEWTTSGDEWRRLKFQTNATAMETVDEGIPGQKARCEYLIGIGASVRQ